MVTYIIVEDVTRYIALGVAAIGVAVSAFYVVLLALGVKTLKELRDSLNGRS